MHNKGNVHYMYYYVISLQYREQVLHHREECTAYDDQSPHFKEHLNSSSTQSECDLTHPSSRETPSLQSAPWPALLHILATARVDILYYLLYIFLD